MESFKDDGMAPNRKMSIELKFFFVVFNKFFGHVGLSRQTRKLFAKQIFCCLKDRGWSQTTTHLPHASHYFLLDEITAQKHNLLSLEYFVFYKRNRITICAYRGTIVNNSYSNVFEHKLTAKT